MSESKDTKPGPEAGESEEPADPPSVFAMGKEQPDVGELLSRFVVLGSGGSGKTALLRSFGTAETSQGGTRVQLVTSGGDILVIVDAPDRQSELFLFRGAARRIRRRRRDDDEE